MKKIRNTGVLDEQQRLGTDQISVSNKTSDDEINQHEAKSAESVQKMQAYAKALKERGEKMSAMVEYIIKSVDPSQEEYQENVTIREKTFGKRSKMECGVPLIVEIPILHDTSHVINDSFRGHLCRDLPGNKRKLFDSTELKEHISLIEDIRRAEKDVMEVQERALRADHKEDRLELGPRDVDDHYSLLRPRTIGGGLVDGSKESIVSDGRAAGEKRAYGIHGELRRLRLRLNRERPKLNVRYCSPGVTRPLSTAEIPEETCLILSTNMLRFSRCAPGSIYTKKITVTNSGKNMTSFKILVNNGYLDGVFEYDYAPRHPLAPGMNAKLTVTYKCKSLADVYELVTIYTNENKKANILVYVENPSPILKYIVESYDMDESYEDAAHRNAPTVCVFECNACLVGAAKNVTVIAVNAGRSAKFVCVPEDVWYTKSVEDVKWTKTMNLDGFKITPSAFQIDCEESLMLNVLFEPRSSSFYCSRFIIVSDNSCAQEVNVFGDGQMFDKRSVRLEGRGLRRSHPPAAAADARVYVLDMGKIGEAVRYVYAKNTSRIKYRYRWTVNHAIVKPGTENAGLNFNVHPSTGLLDKGCETKFRVECGVTDEMVAEQLTGEYRVTATMMIDDIPKKSIINQEIFFEEQEDNPEVVSVKMVEIEAIAEFKEKERISLCINPVVVDLNWYNLKTDACVQETVEFANNGSCPVRVSWAPGETVHNDGAAASVWVAPESFEVPGRGAVRVRVRVEPARPGRIRDALRFRAENRDGDAAHACVYVRGAVERAPEVRVRSAAVVAPDAACAGVPAWYAVDFRMAAARGPFRVRSARYEFDGGSALRPRPGSVVQTYENGSASRAALELRVPIGTEATGISCQLTEWSFDWSSTETTVVHTRAVVRVRPPDVRLNVDAVTVTQPLFIGVPHRRGGIRLLNNTLCDLVYSWGDPVGSDSDGMDCEFRPSDGTIPGRSSVEFQLVLTPKTTGHLNKYRIPCFVQCNAVAPLLISIECWVKEFSATIAYVDRFEVERNIVWHQKQYRWIANENFTGTEQIESERSQIGDGQTSISTKSSVDFNTESLREYEIESEWLQEPHICRDAKLPTSDKWRPLPNSERFEPAVDSYQEGIAFENVECDTAVERRITVRNTTDIPCRVVSKIDNYNYSTSDRKQSLENAEFCSKKHCTIRIENDDRVLNGRGDLTVSLWVTATAWGRYEDVVTVQLFVDDDFLPVVRIPLTIRAITFPIEFPLITGLRTPTVKFSLYYSEDPECRFQVLNNSDIPVQISWRTYNKCEKTRPFGVVLDSLTPDKPNLWSFRIDQYYGTETPRYFMIKPLILKLGPKEQGFVTFFLDRSKEELIDRDSDNMVYGKAIGKVTALEAPGNHCVREDGFKLKSVVVELSSETRHSILPNLVLREQDIIFHISASEMYSLHRPSHTVTRLFTMLNRLRYPATISFEIDGPFTIKTVRTMRCGSRPGNAKICIHYEDLVEIVATFEAHVHFPILKLSTSHINFGQVVVRETKSVDVMLSSYSGPERFIAFTENEGVFAVSPTNGVASHVKPTTLTVTFRPKTDEWYSSTIEISSAVYRDVMYVEVSGVGIL